MKRGSSSVYDVSIDYSIVLYAIYPHYSYAIGDKEIKTNEEKKSQGSTPNGEICCVCNVRESAARENSRDEICVGESCGCRQSLHVRWLVWGFSASFFALCARLSCGSGERNDAKSADDRNVGGPWFHAG
jgi:hypothetical protein